MINNKLLPYVALSLIVFMISSCASGSDEQVTVQVKSTKSQAQKPKSELLSKYSSEIDALKANFKIQKAFEHIITIEPRSLKDLIELTEIPAPPFMEDKRDDDLLSY